MHPDFIPDALANYAESWLGARETSSNRGPEVDFFVRVAGGNPEAKPPWCAYFVTFCCDALKRMGLDLHPVKTGRAVNHWLKAEESRRIAPEDIWSIEQPRGLIYIRTRTSKPVSDTAKVQRGISRTGHVGIVVRVENDDTIIGVAGNSSGAGHSSGSGAVCYETIKRGDRAYERLVGFVSVVDRPEEDQCIS